MSAPRPVAPRLSRLSMLFRKVGILPADEFMSLPGSIPREDLDIKSA